ncbi:hypothetical protein WJX74_010704 [Apatococcus lobatus]|uniref:Transcription elongation factor SPT4 homolog n=1 Tax=Apatococcus lobatus TaxID=904363 RepID=A0AAW1RRE6_9CHLO
MASTGSDIQLDVIPKGFGNNLRACIVCRLVKTYDQFLSNGCDNCPFLDMAGHRDQCLDCTTPTFAGMISLIQPQASWAGKWLHLGKFVPGSYAIKVTTPIPREVEDLLDQNNITWHLNRGD